MKHVFVGSLVIASALAVAFLCGRASQGGAASEPTLEAQERGPDPKKRDPQPVVGATTGAKAPLVYGGESASAGSANGYIAVTGSYGVGTSVLYVLDTNTKQLAVYEARGGSPGSRKLFLVGARRIDLDLQLVGYNDDSESELQYDALKRRFDDPKAAPADAASKTKTSGAHERSEIK